MIVKNVVKSCIICASVGSLFGAYDIGVSGASPLLEDTQKTLMHYISSARSVGALQRVRFDKWVDLLSPWGVKSETEAVRSAIAKLHDAAVRSDIYSLDDAAVQIIKTLAASERTEGSIRARLKELQRDYDAKLRFYSGQRYNEHPMDSSLLNIITVLTDYVLPVVDELKKRIDPLLKKSRDRQRARDAFLKKNLAIGSARTASTH